MNRFGRCCAVFLLMIATLAALPGPAGAAAQVLETTMGLYQSPTYGYLFRWDPESWQVTRTSSEGGLDVLEMQNGTTSIQFAAFEAFDGDPDQCLTDAASRIQAQDPTAFAPAHYDDGTAAEEHGDGYAYGAFLSGPGPALVVQVECRTLLQNRAVLQLTSVMASADYTSGDDGMLLIDNVALPRGAFVTRPEAADKADSQNTYRTLDTGVGLRLDVISHVDPYTDPSLPAAQAGSRWVAVDVSIDNTGEVPVDIDASTFTARDDRGNGYPIAFYSWTQPTGDPSATVQTIDPDQSVAATLVYQAPSDVQLTTVACACGANPAVPVEVGSVAPDPRTVFPPPPYMPCGSYNWESPKVVVDSAGSERVTLTATWLTGGEGLQFAIGIENSGTAPLTIAPDDLWLVTDDQALYNTPALTWDPGSGGSATGARELAPGERAVALLTFAIDERPFSGIQLYYLGPDSGQLQDVAWFCVGCGCGGGGRPKVVLGF